MMSAKSRLSSAIATLIASLTISKSSLPVFLENTIRHFYGISFLAWKKKPNIYDIFSCPRPVGRQPKKRPKSVNSFLAVCLSRRGTIPLSINIQSTKQP